MPSTLLHSFSGVVFWRSYKTSSLSTRYGEISLMACLVLVNLPDFDIIPRMFFGLPVRHGLYTHNFFFAAMVAIFWGLWQGKGSLFCLPVFALVSLHFLLDFMGGQHLGFYYSHGVPLFYPFYAENISSPLTFFPGPTHRSWADLFSLHNLVVIFYETLVIGFILVLWGACPKTTGRPSPGELQD
jgi:hypothetical protein